MPPARKAPIRRGALPQCWSRRALADATLTCETPPPVARPDIRVCISMPVTGKTSAAPAAGAIALFATLAGAYVLSQFLRNSIGVIAPDIAAEMRIPAA